MTGKKQDINRELSVGTRRQARQASQLHETTRDESNLDHARDQYVQHEPNSSNHMHDL